MTFDAFIGLVMLIVLLGAIFIGVPISFTLLFLAFTFGYVGMGARGLRPRLLPDHRHDEGGAAGGRAALHLHGLHHRAGGPDGASLHGLPPAARAGARRALSGGGADGHRVRHGDRHRRRGGDRARHHGLADHDQVGLRRQALRRHHHGRRHARHPHPAIGDADRDGSGARRVGGRPLRRGVRPGLPAGRHLHRLSDGPQHLESEARTAGADGGARAFPAA